MYCGLNIPSWARVDNVVECAPRLDEIQWRVESIAGAALVHPNPNALHKPVVGPHALSQGRAKRDGRSAPDVTNNILQPINVKLSDAGEIVPRLPVLGGPSERPRRYPDIEFPEVSEPFKAQPVEVIDVMPTL